MVYEERTSKEKGPDIENRWLRKFFRESTKNDFAVHPCNKILKENLASKLLKHYSSILL